MFDKNDYDVDLDKECVRCGEKIYIPQMDYTGEMDIPFDSLDDEEKEAVCDELYELGDLCSYCNYVFDKERDR